MTTVIMIMFIGFLVGSAYQKWTSGMMNTEEMAYNAGIEEGYSLGYHKCMQDESAKRVRKI